MFLQLLLISPLLLAFQAEPQLKPTSSQTVFAKITFDVSKISPEGLVGRSDSLRSVSYEFCIPAREKYVVEVRSIDATIAIYPHSRGRIGCKSNQYLCINNTHNPQWKEILYAIAHLKYVEQIDEFLGE